MKYQHDHEAFHDWLEGCDDTPDGRPGRPGLPLTRRTFLAGGLGAFVVGCVSPGPSDKADKPLLGFTGIEAVTEPGFDGVLVAPGYRADPVFSWGDPVLPPAPPWRAGAGDDWRAQTLQAGQNHDGMHFFPMPEAPNRRGLLVVNHEYVNPTLHPRGFTVEEDATGRKQRPEAEVRKEQAAHGVSIVELARGDDGRWHTVVDGLFNRRITGTTAMQLTGPAAGHALLCTQSDPGGREVLGTLNNCSMGVTPWGTYLTCEENWKNYFVNRDAGDYAARPTHHRYGLSNGKNSRYYAWESVDERFDATPADAPHGGHVNEPHRFGWVVEIDPFDPQARPIKRTAMGRLVRECCTLSLGEDGRMAFYSGDDTRGEYIYKFVPRGRWQAGNNSAARDLLDDGTLYVARFNEDGSGEWLPLTHGQNGLTEENDFPDQATVLVNARGAADRLGATRMDRPEWVAVHPRTREAYVALTNNRHRGVDPQQPVNRANPRPENPYGHILRWREQNDDPAATRFRWDIFVLAGLPESARREEKFTGSIRGDLFACPDGLAFDAAGRLWIGTDYDDGEAPYRPMGTNQLLCADPGSREIRRFLAGPAGCEVTGITFSPDRRTLWVNIQHPGGSFPAGDGTTRPRSTTLAITKEDGGEIGT